MKVPVPAAALKLLKPLADEAKRRGTPLYAVGGCVRDWLLDRPVFDLDVTVQGDPDAVAAAAGRLLGAEPEPFGRFGTRRVVGKARYRIDVATTRAERYAEPAALPEVTATAVPIGQDLFRRDFTVNALAVRLDDGSHALVDAHGGLKDLRAKLVRVLHPRSFEDDPTRVFRAARFLGRFKWRPAPGLEDMAASARPHATRLSPHRLGHELAVLLGEKDPSAAFALLAQWGYLGFFDPAFPWGRRMPAGVDGRLMALAVALGPGRGRAFIDRFPHERALKARLHAALDLAFSDASPRTEPDPLAAQAALRVSPGLPPAALKPCFLQGADLLAKGLKPGPEFAVLLDEAARLQRAGALKSRAAALKWLAAR
jgi:tRNA nucleotidyltransferase/poly(A) polymerase